MRAFLLLLLSAVTGLGATGADLYVNFESVANGTTLSSAIMGQISKTNGDAVTFSTDIRGTASAVKVVNDTAHAGLLRPVLVNGTYYTNSSPTKALLVDSFASGGDLVKFVWTMKAASRKVSYGYSITLTNWGAGGNFYNAGGLELGVDYLVLSMVDDSPPFFQLENNTAPYGADINVGNNFTIWVSGLWDSANNIGIHQYYNQTNMTLIGFSTASIAHNAAVSDFGWGITGAHSFSANRNFYLNNLILYTNGNVFPVWPGSGLQVPTNSTVTAMSAAITAMSNGDWLIVPATNQTWSSGVTFAKNNCTIAGLGDTNAGGSIITLNGAITGWTVTGTLNVLTNLTITGVGTTDEATGIDHVGYHNRYTHILLKELDVAFYCRAPGLMDHFNLNDNNFSARNIFGFGSGFFESHYRLSRNSTNKMVYETGGIAWTSAKNQTGSGRIMSSQEDQAWCMRFVNIDLNKASASPQPCFDYHGDWDPGELYNPGTLLEIYKVNLNVGASSISGGKFVHFRGSEGYVYSNTVTGAQFDSNQGIVLVEEHPFPEDAIPWPVTNSVVTANLDGATGTHAMSVNDDLTLGAGTTVAGGRNWTNTFNAAFPLVELQYPHPWVAGDLNAGGGGGTINTATTLKIRGVRLK